MWCMVISNFAEKMQLGTWEHESCGYAVNRRITPTLVIEFSRGVEIAEVQVIRRGAEEIEICNLEVRPN